MGMRLATIALLLLLAGSWPPAARADSFRCGSRLITDGDSAGKLEKLCGPPAVITRSEILRRPVIWRFGRPYYLSQDLLPVTVEFWTYNLGPNKLMRRLKLEDGLVVEIETLGHGYFDPDP